MFARLAGDVTHAAAERHQRVHDALKTLLQLGAVRRLHHQTNKIKNNSKYMGEGFHTNLHKYTHAHKHIHNTPHM